MKNQKEAPAYTPKLVCFTCRFGWGYLNGGRKYEELQHVVPVMCSGKVDAAYIMDAFRKGADGVLILGCPDGECHFQNGNYQSRKRVLLLRKTLKEFGIEPERVVIKLDVDPDGTTIPTVIEQMRESISRLGPLAPSV
ncbi:MAG TPA: hydrogenase iron-sulfur subunit [Deltaproteobacteria bacterium]|nr:hydrogenase iron-sulfur subunit [Deltaproteobacteria bacterium]HPR54506.1 hydrogenase iron-sulfur subunit [Deltaproteobacteria bacterium]HXK46614.1 hydrogenase iron-sulfur subunit [Deltaproteobacteria bacterium]